MQHARPTGASLIGEASPGSTDKPGRQPVLPLLAPFSIACFTGALVTDFIYWRTVAVMWETLSDWLITAGMIMAGFAIIAFVIDVVRGKWIRKLAWPGAVGYALAVLLSLINAFVHSRDAYTAVVPTGLMLSGLVVVVLLTGWVGSTLIYRHRVGGTT